MTTTNRLRDIGIAAAISLPQAVIAYALTHVSLPTLFGILAFWFPFLTLTLPAVVLLPRIFTAEGKTWLNLVVSVLGSLAWIIGAGLNEKGGVVASLEYWGVLGLPIYALPTFLAISLATALRARRADR